MSTFLLIPLVFALVIAGLGRQDVAVTINPDNMDFGDQVVGRRSKAKRITVTNTGRKSVYIKRVEISGDDSSDFLVANDSCAGATVEKEKSCFIDITFMPFDTDERIANMTLIDNAYDSPQTVSLTGNGINSADFRPFAR